MNDKIKDIAVTIVFTLTLGVLFVINIAKKDTEISISERRKLAQAPELTTKSLFDGTYFEKIDSYVTDQFIARDTFRKVKVEIELAAKKEYNNLYTYNDYIIEETFPLNESSVNNLTNRINYIKNTYLANNKNIYYTVVPDKNYFIDNGNLKLDYSRLQNIMQDNLLDVKYINIFDKLSLEDYYKTDTHWRQENLLKVATTLADQMDFEVSSINKETVVTSFEGSYAGRLPVTNTHDTIKVLTNNDITTSSVYNYEAKKYTDVYDYTKINSLEKYDIYLSGAVPIIDIINNNSKSDKELIVFRDSYGSSLVPLFISGYKKITVIDTRYVSSKILNQFVKFDDQDVLFMYSILTINDSFSIR